MPPVADRDGGKKSFLLKCDLQFVSHQEMALIKKGDERWDSHGASVMSHKQKLMIWLVCCLNNLNFCWVSEPLFSSAWLCNRRIHYPSHFHCRLKVYLTSTQMVWLSSAFIVRPLLCLDPLLISLIAAEVVWWLDWTLKTSLKICIIHIKPIHVVSLRFRSSYKS